MSENSGPGQSAMRSFFVDRPIIPLIVLLAALVLTLELLRRA